ncbi:sensor histidine kinase, partial [Rhodovulum sulfidophilum]|nr:sensor histidine kinase [Rhodovulum sulfidophilum]
MSSARRSPYRSAFPLRGGWFLRLAIFALISTAVATVWTTNAWLTERFTESTRSRAQVRMALYSGNVVSELQRASVVPLLLSRDPTLIRALENVDFSQSSQLLISYVDEIGAASLQLLDDSGRVVAATDRSKIGTNLRSAPFFVEALRSNDTVFITSRAEAGNFTFTYSRAIMVDRRKAGVIVVGVDLAKFEQSWAGISDAVIVTDSEGQIILATEPRWRGHKVEAALEARSAPSAIARAIQATADWGALPPDAYVRGEAVMRNEARIPFRGWRIISFT